MSDPVVYNKVTLTFDIASILKQVQLRSLHGSSRSYLQDGASLESSQSITDADLDVAAINLRDAANIVYQKLQSLTRRSTTPFQYNVPSGNTRLITYELWLNKDWDTVLQTSLSIAIERLFVNYLLKDWYATIGQQVGYQLAQSNYDNAGIELRNIIDSRKTPVRRPNSYF